MITTVVYDSKPYTVEFFRAAAGAEEIDWKFLEPRLDENSAWLARGAQVVCAFVNDRLDRPVLAVLAELGIRLIALRCAGYNNVDLDTAQDLQIDVVRVPAYSPEAVAEHAVALLLTLNRKIHRAYNRVREQNFSLNGLVGFVIAGKTVGIIGTGKIGKIVGRIFHGFRAKLLAYDPFPDLKWAEPIAAQYVELNQLLQESHIITLHAPLTPETYHMINADSFAKMQPGTYLINTSRGKLVETTAMIRALKQGHLGGVGLDVYEEEEGIFFEDLSDRALQDDELARLLTFPNVLITGHQAFFTREALGQIADTTIENISRCRAGREYLEGTLLTKSPVRR